MKQKILELHFIIFMLLLGAKMFFPFNDNAVI